MPVQITNKTFTDIFGNTTNYYRANTGDEIEIELEIQESIRVQSGGSTGLLEMDPVNNIVNWNTGNFLDEGFRVGDTVSFTIYSSSAVILHFWTATVNTVSANAMDVSTFTNLYDYTAGEILVITVTDRKRESFNLMLNHVQNGIAGSEFSLIDGEATVFNFDISTTINGSIVSGIQVGNQSGQFNCTAEIEDDSIYTPTFPDLRFYRVRIKIIQSGLYQSNFFDFSNCLKFYAKFKWQSLLGESFNNYVHVFNDDANTGWFDQAFNTDPIDATLIQGITELDYINPTSGTIIIDSASTDYAFGSAYVSQDSTYYKNRPYNQSKLSMIIPTQEILVGNTATSFTNEFGAGYSLKIDNVTLLGTQYTIDYTFTPMGSFGTFIGDQEEDNRTMYIWARFGNVNLLLFESGMITDPPVGGLLDVVQNIFLDHSENVTNSTDTANGYEANIEDDLGFTGKFLLNKSEVYQYLTAYIEAYNTVTDENFILGSVLFDFSSVPYNGIKHLVNFNVPVQIQLPLTSLKRNAILELDATIDTPTQYGIHVYFPFLYRWEYWLEQLNASIDFYPNNQTKNWYPYDSTNDWTVRLHIEAVKDGLAYTFDNELLIKNYDSEPLIDQQIQLYIDATNTPVGVVVENELMRIVATHTNVDLSPWDQTDTWGMITVEPTESSPRYLVSSVVPFDNDVNNPLTPLSGLLVPITYPSLHIARMECYFDPTKINLQNGCKFTAKIKGCLRTGEPEVQKIMTDGTQKITTTNINKIIA